MGIVSETASVIIRAHKQRPIDGDVLLCGRQSVYFTPNEAATLISSHGLTPQIPVEACDLDFETRLGGEGADQRRGDAISDRSFFKMLGVGSLTVLDHSNYEGASLVVDLNYPVAPHLTATFDFVIDGGTLDNVFNPAQAIMNISQMLRPNGRLLTYNMYSNHFSAYTILPHQWYLDYFAINHFSFGQVYFAVHEFAGDKAYYQVNLEKRANSRRFSNNFPITDATTGIAAMAYAVKSSVSTYDRQPSQDVYRSDEEWRAVESGLSLFLQYECPPLVRSGMPIPITMPGGDDFQYIDADGTLITQSNMGLFDRQLCARMVSALIAMDKMCGDAPWGILELEKAFYVILNGWGDARVIVAKSNVILFDARMLNKDVTIDGARKEIYPAAVALMLDIPVLALSVEPEIDVLWKRVSRYFRHMRLYSASHGNPGNYFLANTHLSASLEHGDYRGSPLAYIRKVEALLAKLAPG